MIPIAKPCIGTGEIKNVIDVLNSNMLAYGSKGKEFEERLAKYIGTKECVICNSGTSALFMAYKALEFGPGDEVICPCFTFAATSDMIKAVGATPIFVDIKNDFNIDETKIEELITDKTKGIVVVHLYGKPANVKEIMIIAKKYKLKVVEDNAQSFGAIINKKKTGSFGDIGICSFYGTKILTTGEGGACFTNNKKIAEKLRLLRNHGMHGLEYDYSMVGFNFNMSDINAAIGLAQLDNVEEFIAKRIAISWQYYTHLTDKLELPIINCGYRHVFNNYSFLVKNRDNFIKQMQANGIICRAYYPKPLADLPNATRISKEIVSIPIRPDLTQSEIQHIIDMVNDIIGDMG